VGEEVTGMTPYRNSTQEYTDEIPRYGHDHIGSFALPKDFWWQDYFRPLEEKICELRRKCREDPHGLRILDGEQQEVELYKKYSSWYGSAFMAMRKGSE
jgi:hypothetical protein